MSKLRATIRTLAENFADAVIRALHSAPLSELAAAQPSQAAARAPAPKTVFDARATERRAIAASVDLTVERIVEAVAKTPQGLRADQIQKAVGLQQRDIKEPLAAALERNVLRKRGQRRGTTYFMR